MRFSVSAVKCEPRASAPLPAALLGFLVCRDELACVGDLSALAPLVWVFGLVVATHQQDDLAPCRAEEDSQQDLCGGLSNILGWQAFNLVTDLGSRPTNPQLVEPTTGLRRITSLVADAYARRTNRELMSTSRRERKVKTVPKGETKTIGDDLFQAEKALEYVLSHDEQKEYIQLVTEYQMTKAD
jgi:hypothetical protein